MPLLPRLPAPVQPTYGFWFRPKFQGIPQLRSKAFTVRPDAKCATNVYVWESDDAAKAFFTEQLLERVTGLYGVRPTVELAQVAALVENR
jgi:hypothetical protein